MGGGRDSGSTDTCGIAIDESRKETANGVAGFPNRFSRPDGHPSMLLSPPGVLWLFPPSLFLLAFYLVSPFVSFPLPAVHMPVPSSPSCCLPCHTHSAKERKNEKSNEAKKKARKAQGRGKKSKKMKDEKQEQRSKSPFRILLHILRLPQVDVQFCIPTGKKVYQLPTQSKPYTALSPPSEQRGPWSSHEDLRKWVLL